MSNANQNISTENYKGVRDFYPEELQRRRYLESVMRQTVEQFGYEEIDASIIEESKLFDAKSGDELAQEQSYRFEDRGGRDIMLRPELTPTVARMFAARAKSLPSPTRWYSIANVFRYERPQRGRLREHWQLNADLFGVEGSVADVEIISLAHQLLRNFGADEDDFVIQVSSRTLFADFCESILEIDTSTRDELARLVDKRAKMDQESFTEAIQDILSEEAADTLLTYLSAGDIEILQEEFPRLKDSLAELEAVLDKLVEREVGNAIFEPSLIRGIAYYTGIVFEVFDTSPENNRSLFGGGRYDNLMDMFDTEPVPAVGFGAGDVTLTDFLDVHELWPQLETSLDVAICLVDVDEHADYGYRIAQQLQEGGLYTRVDIAGSNVGTQIKHADNAGARFVIIIGDDEIESDDITIKQLESGEQTTLPKDELLDFFTDSN